MSRYLFREEAPELPPVHTFTVHNIQMATNEVILAMNGKISRADATLCARAVFP